MITLFSSTPNLWESLQSETRPIFLYGTGNGGDKILDVLSRYHIVVSGVFASDGFVRTRTFHDMPVMCYTDVVERYGEDIVILLAFGTTQPEIKRFIQELNKRHTLYIPDVPLYGGALFDRDAWLMHRERIEKTAQLWADEYSRQLFYDALLFRWTGLYQYLQHTTDFLEDLRTLFDVDHMYSILDGGAYRGDSASTFCTAFPQLQHVWAVESDEKSCEKLAQYAALETRAAVHPIHAALWNTVGEITLAASASRGSGIAGNNRRSREKKAPSETIDHLHESCGAWDCIKLDVEGAEWNALAGGEKTLLTDRPALMLSLYHRTEDLWEIPLYIHEKLPNHMLYLRRPDCIPLWDMTLFATL